MKYIFSITFLFLVIVSYGTWTTAPDVNSKTPTIHWITDNNPARAVQVEGFEKWLVSNGYTAPDGGPVCKLKLDTSNRDATKMIIQGVSGVADTIWDVSSTEFQQIYSIGLLEDVTKSGKQMGFSPTHTYSAVRPLITMGGKQYLYPCNVAVRLMWVNKKMFKKFNQPLPPKQWNFEQFEKMGKAYVKAANKNLPYRQYFYTNTLDRPTLYRSLGLSFYNETSTSCDLNDSRYIRVLRLLYKWTYVDHILPSMGDVNSFATQSGYGGASTQLFYKGNYAMKYNGRWMLIQLRKFNKSMQLTVVETPNGGLPNTIVTTRAAGIYKGASKQEKKFGKLFLEYLASKRYNMTIVQDADALPPVPKYTKISAFTHPEKYPNEWGLHEQFSNAEKNIAIAAPNSPFVLTSTADRIEKNAYEKFMNNRMTAKQSAATVAKRVNEKIQQRLQQDPSLKPLYKKRVKLQKKIDEYRSADKKIPASWIKNVFYREYYKKMGWLKNN